MLEPALFEPRAALIFAATVATLTGLVLGWWAAKHHQN